MKLDEITKLIMEKNVRLARILEQRELLESVSNNELVKKEDKELIAQKLEEITMANNSYQEECTHPLVLLFSSNYGFNYVETYCECCGQRKIYPREHISDEVIWQSNIIDLRRLGTTDDIYLIPDIKDEIEEYIVALNNEGKEIDQIQLKIYLWNHFQRMKLQRCKKQND